MVDMAHDPEETGAALPERVFPPTYPYGLSISLSEKELEKLDLPADCEIGDILHMVSMAKVTNFNKSENGCRIEMQIFDIEVLEDENEEFERPKMNPSKFYKDED